MSLHPEIVSRLYHGFQERIARMRSENKFNGYRYKTYPTLVRGHEGNEEWEDYVNIVHNEYSRNRSGYDTQWYRFTYFVFVQRPLSDVENPGLEPFQVDLMIEYKFQLKQLKVFLRSYHHSFHPKQENPDYTDFIFDWETLINDSKSIDETVDIFEHCFLEVPLVQSIYNPTGINYPVYFSHLLPACLGKV